VALVYSTTDTLRKI